MNDLDVRIIELGPFHVVSFHGFGDSPESDALHALQTWANRHDILVADEQNRLFGFNNPGPSPGSPHYGYEVWLVTGKGCVEEESTNQKTFEGGSYAVTRVVGIENIGSTWQNLVEWREDSPYHPAHHQWLEEHLSPLDTPLEVMVLDLYLPISTIE